MQFRHRSSFQNARVFGQAPACRKIFQAIGRDCAGAVQQVPALPEHCSCGAILLYLLICSFAKRITPASGQSRVACHFYSAL